MQKPYVICHILSALDGKIEGPFMTTEVSQIMSQEYGRIRQEYQADAWLYGTVTTKEFTNNKKTQLKKETICPDGDFIAKHSEAFYYISIDTQGEIGWDSHTFQKAGRPDAHIIEVLTEKTSAAYRTYLREKEISYIIAGTHHLDTRLACEKLHKYFNIKRMLICGGGTINWTFLQDEMIDELSLVLVPITDGETDSVTVFEKMPFLQQSKPQEFILKDVKRLKSSGIHLIYDTKHIG